jgi:hypothetical protein
MLASTPKARCDGGLNRPKTPAKPAGQGTKQKGKRPEKRTPRHGLSGDVSGLGCLLLGFVEGLPILLLEGLELISSFFDWDSLRLLRERAFLAIEQSISVVGPAWMWIRGLRG